MSIKEVTSSPKLATDECGKTRPSMNPLKGWFSPTLLVVLLHGLRGYYFLHARATGVQAASTCFFACAPESRRGSAPGVRDCCRSVPGRRLYGLRERRRHVGL